MLDLIVEGNSKSASIEHNGAIDILPDEILAEIFLLNAQRKKELRTYDPLTTTLSTITVCRRWYMIGHNYPSLWTPVIDYERHPPLWIKHLLERSKSAALDVGEDSIFKHVQLRNPRALSVLQYMFDHAARIRTLSLQIRLAPWNFICTNFLQNPAPMLEYLNLITSCPFPDCLFPGPLFADSAPRLRRAHFQRCLVDFSSSVLHNLTELSVMDILAPGVLSFRRPDHPLKIAPTVSEWIKIIREIPSLQYLTLSNAITPSDEDDDVPIIQLSALVFLTIGARFRDGVAFLRHLEIPPTCNIRLRFSCNKTSPGLDGMRLLSFLGNQLSYWREGVNNRYLQAKILSGDRIHFGNSKRVGYVWDRTEAEVIEEHRRVSSDPLLWLILSLDSSEDTITFFNHLLQLYEPTYSTTTTLDLWLDEEFTVTNPSPPVSLSLGILHSFTALSVLDLLGRSPLYLLPLLQPALESDAPPPLPALRMLCLTRADFEDQQYAVYHAILNFLEYRTRKSFPLTDLEIFDSYIDDDSVQELTAAGDVAVTTRSLRG